MSITVCKEIAQGRGAGYKFQNKKFVRTATRVFRITTDTKHDEWYILNNATAAGAPDLFDPHPTNSSLLVKNIDPRQEDVDGRGWLLTITYDDESVDQNNPDPLSRNIKYRMEWNRVPKDMITDADGIHVVNTASDPFEDAPQSNETRPVLIAVKNYPASDFDDIVALAIDYAGDGGSVNTDTFHGATAGHVLCRSITTGDLQSENNTDYYAVTHEFEFRSDDAIFGAISAGVIQFERTPGPWDRIILNRGFNYLTVANDVTSRVQIPSKEPQKLNEDGTLWNQPGNNLPGGFFRVFREFKERPFSVLGV